MNLKIKAFLQLTVMIMIGLVVGFGLAFYRSMVGDQITLYTIAALSMAALFYSMYLLLLGRLELDQQIQAHSDRLKEILKNK